MDYKPDKEKKKKWKAARFTEQEFTAVEKAAKKAVESVAAYMRNATLARVEAEKKRKKQ